MTPRVHLDDYAGLVGEAAVEDIRALARPLEGRRALMVNSTAVGGGGGGTPQPLDPPPGGSGDPNPMEVIRGGAEFFGVTKAMHNVLHGTPVEITKPMLELFQEVNVENAASLDLDADLVVIHDPQPVALVTGRANGQGHWVRRCHVDVSRPQPDVWAFLRQYVVQYDASVFSAPEFSQRLPITQYMIHPAIDPLAEKNRGMAPGEVEEIRTRLGIRDDRPFVTEALWKKRPVIASAVGGTPLQVGHNLTGLLVHSIEGTAHRIRSLLRDPEFARRLGENGHEYVMTRFLTTSNLRGWLALAISLMHPGERIIHLG